MVLLQIKNQPLYFQGFQYLLIRILCIFHHHWLRRVAYSLFITSALEETPEKQKARELGYLREWMDCDFVDVDKTFESKVLPQIPKTISPGISPEQEAAATEAVASFVKAFSSGRYEDFQAF